MNESTSSNETSVEQPTSDVVPLSRTTNGRNGTSNRGKGVPKSTGDPRADRAAKRTQRFPGAAPAKSASTRSTKSATSTSAQPALASDSPKRAGRGESAIVRERQSRVTGTVVQIVNTLAPKSPVPAESAKPWAARCVDHEHVARYVTRAAARAVASDPSTWCRKCKSAATETAK